MPPFSVALHSTVAACSYETYLDQQIGNPFKVCFAFLALHLAYQEEVVEVMLPNACSLALQFDETTDGLHLHGHSYLQS